MNKNSFSIHFEVELEDTKTVSLLQAIVESDEATGNFDVHSFKRLVKKDDEILSEPSHLPGIHIKKIESDGKLIWIHLDSERESQLSALVGKAIEIVKIGNAANDTLE